MGRRRNTENPLEIRAWDDPEGLAEQEASVGLDLATITREASELAIGPFGYLLWVDARVVKHGLPPMSEWWRYTLQRFYDSAKRWCIVRVGRGGGKSTTLLRMAATEALFAERTVPPGQRWMWPFVSASSADAVRSVNQLEEVLKAIGGLSYDVNRAQATMGIQLNDVRGNAIEIRSMAGTVQGLSGPSAIGATIDEEAKLRDRSSNVNPASEILATIIQTFRARPGIRAIRCSSAWSHDGSHALAIKDGDTEVNYVARIGAPCYPAAIQGFIEVASWEHQRGNAKEAEEILRYASTVTPESPNIPTWVANPTISALACRREVDALPAGNLEGLSRTKYWLRENASVPQEVGAAGVVRADITGLVDRTAQLLSVHSDPRNPWHSPEMVAF